MKLTLGLLWSLIQKYQISKLLGILPGSSLSLYLSCSLALTYTLVVFLNI